MEIAIVGIGVVGNAFSKMLEKQGYSLKKLDIEKGYHDDISKSDIIFICINDTDKEMMNIKSVVKEIIKINLKGIIVIRTTITPGTTDALIMEHKREIAYMPEFLREWDAEEDALHPDKIVIGTKNNFVFEKLSSLFQKIILPEKILQVTPIEAEIAKLALNSLAVIKVVFAEEIYDLTKHFGIDYNKIYKIFQLDKNINERHLEANKDGYRGANGKCLPKDIGFLSYAGKKVYNNLPLIDLAQQLNINYLMMKEKIKDD